MILITGASGFIGGKLLPLIKKRYPKENIFLLDQNKHNLVTKRGLEKIPTSPKIVFHLAASTDTSKRDQRCNNVGTKNLLDFLTGIGPNTHFIFTSSQAIFSGRINTHEPITNKTKPSPNNEYGKTKVEAEKILIKEAKKRKFKLTIIRLPTVWGKNPRKNAFLNFLTNLVNKNSLFSKLNWPGKVALINVDDAAKIILNSAKGRSKTISIATEFLTLSEIFEKITIKAEKTYKQVKVPKFIWRFGQSLRPYLKFFEFVLPVGIYNYFWRASIVIDSPLWHLKNINGKKFI